MAQDKFYEKFIKFWDKEAPESLGYVLILGDFQDEGIALEVRANVDDDVVLDFVDTANTTIRQNKNPNKVLN